MHLPALSPSRWLLDALEFRRLRRRLPNAHRAWSHTSGKLRPESDAEYLARLRVLARERPQLRDKTVAAVTAPAVPPRVTADASLGPVGPSGRITNDLQDELEAAEELTPDTTTPALIAEAIDQTRLLLVNLTLIRRLSRSHRGDQDKVAVNLR